MSLGSLRQQAPEVLLSHFFSCGKLKTITDNGEKNMITALKVKLCVSKSTYQLSIVAAIKSRGVTWTRHVAGSGREK